jgi:isoquinoline 1-oxidoreductase beta subunit
MAHKLSRRRFLQASGAASGAVAIHAPRLGAAESASQTIAGWVRIDADTGITLLVNATGMGQGARSALAQILAEELELDWSQVRVDFAPIEPAYYGMWVQSTAASLPHRSRSSSHRSRSPQVNCTVPN